MGGHAAGCGTDLDCVSPHTALYIRRREMSDSNLALRGGRPIRESFLPFHRPSIGPEEEAEVVAALRSGWVTTGPRAQRLEAAFRELLEVPHALAVNSCTAALHLALMALGVGPGDEVVTTPI